MIRQSVSVHSTIFLLVLLVFGACSWAEPVDIVTPAPTFDEIINRASRIARVEIVSSRPVHEDLLNVGPICGYLLSANVTYAMKGGATPFEFFFPSKLGSLTFDRSYFVIAFSQAGLSREQEISLSDLANPETAARLHCLLSEPNYVPASYVTLWSFDKAAGQKFGGEWLDAADNRDALFCGYPTRLSDRPGLEVRRLDNREPPKFIVSWQSVKKLVTNNISGTPAPMLCAHE